MTLFSYFKTAAVVRQGYKVSLPCRTNSSNSLAPTFVVVDVQIIRRRKDGNNRRKSSRPSLAVHSIPSVLRLMRPDHAQQIIPFQKRASSIVREEIGTSADMVMRVHLVLVLFLSEILERVRPQEVAHEAVGWGFAEPVQLADIVHGGKFGG
jgi:hypothetical protein